jgi:serine/threonine-protein kinase
VREGLPDVQRRRPEISAALAAVVERATAKDVANRYPTAREMVTDLEEVLTIEAARAGGAEGEATTVLDQISARRGGRRRWLRRLGMAALYVILAAAVAVGAGLLIDSGQDGGQESPEPADLAPIQLGEGDAVDYDPAPGDGQEGSASVQLALDGDRTTFWESERYDTPELGSIKDGVGLYLDAGRPLVARAIRIVTPQEGWRLELYVANTVPDSVAGWTKVGSGEMDRTTKTFNLDTGGQRFRYYLIWITRLAEDSDGNRAKIAELRLLG